MFEMLIQILFCFSFLGWLPSVKGMYNKTKEESRTPLPQIGNQTWKKTSLLFSITIG